MRIKEKTWQNRRDFKAIYVCEHCGHEHEGSGYDDAYFHKNVIPELKCQSCEKTADDSYVPIATRYHEGMQV